MTDDKPIQPLKALSPILVTEFGIVIDVKLEHPTKKELPMLVKEVESVTVVNCVQK